MKIRPLGAELFHADRQTDMKLTAVLAILFLIGAIPMCLHKLLKINISQNTSIYCQYVSWQLVSTYKVIISPYRTVLAWAYFMPYVFIL